MTNKTFEQSILSRPVYGTLSLTDAPAHLIIADAEGAEAICAMLADAPADALKTVHIVYVPREIGQTYLDRLKALGAGRFYESPSIDSMLPALDRILATTHMGTQICVAGTEGLMGRATRLAMEHGYDHRAIQSEHRGSMARRVQCVHCKGITEDVTTQPCECSHCGLLLLVRDHYSRRIAAFQGVCINAEDPSYNPEKEEAFS
ncbi:dimethylamine monooxygenase subunit DmmA family protein [Coralliovum pocilloporae]|uniref:dimethylamine monooxygenase subunit DmmA family protein n=1 Tax=Coralliovum pocilloporae TaxID=3066369 RepID=UPI003306D0A5